MIRKRSRPTRRAVLASALGAGLSSPRRTAESDAAGELILNDASRLEPTRLARHILVQPDQEANTIALLRRELSDAAAAGRPVALGIARHSMGGQSLARGGTAFTFATPTCEIDSAAQTYRAHVGTTWRAVIAQLDPLGFSPAVMQSNNDFGVGSTLSVNAHGWPVPHPPFGSTVKAFRLMLADGTIVRCAHQENDALFRCVMGGYGLFGIILDLDVEMVRNVFLRPTVTHHEAEDFAPHFLAACADPMVAMAYGRLSITRDRLLADALLVSFRPSPSPPAILPRAEEGYGIVEFLARETYRGEVGSDWAKRFRFGLESALAPAIGWLGVTRNRLLNESAAVLAERDPRRVDILHEYFLPAENFPGFLAACRRIVARSEQDLLNVTLRYVAADRLSVLSYAPAPRLSAVLSFSQATTQAADAAMERMTQDLVEQVLALGGSFYLPYRLHARRDQLERAYPALASFVESKRHYDPRCVFRNTLWDKWLGDASGRD